MKILVLGHRGMLGHVVVRFLRDQRLEVLTTEERYLAKPDDPLIRAIETSRAQWIINCIGLVKRKSSDLSAMIRANSMAPAHIKSCLRPGQRMIHASTDCVFSGKGGWYSVGSRKDPDDSYGFSKMLGDSIAERDKCIVLRCSLIGPEEHSAIGLMAWFLNQRRGVKGFTNHFWNGVTTLDWAMFAHDVITGKRILDRPLIQIGTTPLSKYELLRLIRDTWCHQVKITPAAAPCRVDRTLEPEVHRGSIEDQLVLFNRWYFSHSRGSLVKSPHESMSDNTKGVSIPLERS